MYSEFLSYIVGHIVYKCGCLYRLRKDTIATLAVARITRATVMVAMSIPKKFWAIISSMLFLKLQ